MQDPGELWVRALARAFADDRRVLLVGDSFELLSTLAEAPVRELVVISPGADPDAPAGQTLTGAPLRMRPDWAERASSKDLIVDPAGLASAADVKRVLKKRGVYLCGVRGPALAALPFVTAVRGGVAQAVFVGEPPLRTVVDLGAEPARPDVVFLASADAAIAPPQLVGLFAASPVGPSVDAGAAAAAAEDLAAARAEADGLRLALDAAEDALDQAYDARDAAVASREDTFEAAAALRDRIEALEGEAAQLAAERDAARAMLTEAETARAAADAAHAELAATLAAQADLAADYEAVRAELAERRVADRQSDALRARFEAARSQMAAEVTELREQLRAVGNAGTDVEVALADRDAARATAEALQTSLVACLGALAPNATVGAPPPVAAPAEAHRAWLDTAALARGQAQTAQQRALQQLEALRSERAALDRNLREHAAALTVTRAELAAARVAQTAATPTLAPDTTLLVERLAALETALEAERQLRATAAALASAELAAGRAARDAQGALQTQVAEARRAAAQAELAAAAAAERAARVRHELDARAQRAEALDALVAAHAQMQARLVGALGEAEQLRDEAVAARRLADENLRLLRLEFERHLGQPPGDPDAEARARLVGTTGSTEAPEARPAVVIRALRAALDEAHRALAAAEQAAASDRARAQDVDLGRALLSALQQRAQTASAAPSLAALTDAAPATTPADAAGVLGD